MLAPGAGAVSGSPPRKGSREGRGQQLTLSGARNLDLTLFNCEGCTINGVPLDHLLSAYKSQSSGKSQSGEGAPEGSGGGAAAAEGTGNGGGRRG